MRQPLKVDDEGHLLMRSLSVDYAAGGKEVTHSHSWPQLLYAQTGAIRVAVAGDLLVVPPRRGLWIPSEQPHRLTMIGSVALRTLYCRPGHAPVHRRTSVFDVGGLLHELILRICDQQWLDERSVGDRRLAALTLDEISAAPINELRLVMPTDPRALQLAETFLDDAEPAADLAQCCAAVGLSRRTAERIFRKQTGLSPARWSRLARLSVGLSCLSSGESIEVAAQRAGYSSRAAFSAAFAKTFGYSPGALRPGATQTGETH